MQHGPYVLPPHFPCVRSPSPPRPESPQKNQTQAPKQAMFATPDPPSRQALITQTSPYPIHLTPMRNVSPSPFFVVAPTPQATTDIEVSVMNNPMMAMRQILTQDHLRDHDQRKNLEEARTKGRMSDLELELLFLRQQVRTLQDETQTYFQQRIQTLTSDSTSLKDQVLRVESSAEKEKHASIEAVENLANTDDNSATLKAKMNEVLNTCRMLLLRVQELELEKMRHEEETRERENNMSHLKTKLGTHGELENRVQELEALLLEKTSELDNILAEAQKKEDDQHQQLANYITSVKDLKSSTAALEAEKRAVELNLGRQIQSLSAEMEDLTREKSSKALEYDRDKQLLVKEYEQQLEDLRSANQESTRVQELEQLLTRAHAEITDFKKQIELATSERDSMAREHSRQKQQVVDYEQQIEDFHTAEVKYKKQQALARQEAEQCADDLRTELSKVTNTSRGFQTKVQELEIEVENVRRLLKDRDGQLKDAKKSHDGGMLEMGSLRLSEAEKVRQLKAANEKIESLEERLRDAEEARENQLEQVSKDRKTTIEAHATWTRTHSSLKEKNEQLEKEIERLDSQSRQKAEAELHQKEELAEVRRKLEESEARNRTLQNELAAKSASMPFGETRSDDRSVRFAGEDPTSTPTTRKSVADSRKSFAASRKSLVGYAIASKSHLADVFMPAGTDPFIKKVREAIARANDTLESAMEVNMKCLEDQLMRLSNEGGSELRSLVSEELDDFERKAAADKVDATHSDLKALSFELSIEHQLSSQTREQAEERINFEKDRCDDVRGILRLRSPLYACPENVLQMLVGFYESPASAEEWAGRPAPTHWAAENGRRDVLMYLLENGDALLLTYHDDNGRSPLYYAQLGKQESLSVWMREELELDATAHKQEDVPTFAGLPQSHAMALQKIVENGWRAMTWKDNHSMLHWAAAKGREDLAKYLVSLDADPNLKNGKGKSPIDIATEAGNDDLVKVLKDLRTKRRQSRVARRS